MQKNLIVLINRYYLYNAKSLLNYEYWMDDQWEIGGVDKVVHRAVLL